MFDLLKCNEILKSELSYRLKQVEKAIFQDLVDDWWKVTNLPQSLRTALNKHCPLAIKVKFFPETSSRAIKALLSLDDDLKVESVLMKHRDGRNTVCVSSQVGCPLGCKFCATGKMGFKRNLTTSEIVNQVLVFARLLKKQNQRVTNVVFMGMGEPFLNTNNVLAAIMLLNDKEGFNLGARHFSISTVGIIEGIERLTDESPQVNLAISLHATNDKLRSWLMPINKKYPLNQVMKAVDRYIQKTRRRVMLEYVMIGRVNDSPKEAEALAVLAKRPLCFVNLINYNPTGNFQPSPIKKIIEFKRILEKHKIPVTQRYRFGQKVKAACGQLAG